ncbi:cadherin-like beta sandwich domain-containing protein [Blautia obeum]|uniref:cadherin-like beta sandwich domain-containing protein n=1 Tax=Blautia obeum TaxID=40520 RepID=UPI001D062731|nr:cadherin-like beta sandwich domain-containing protein [Blautia obeum]MCB6333599.1 cadherin-like beta sandwich domain-containing protein [Blautia obeum]MCQ5356718.1 cadherin-like beta sandwich domain-containing protein [Blautia obeum]
MRGMGKWLAVLLSVTMLTGTAPVYGADISVESEFSSGTTDGDVLSDEPGETEVPDESVNGDAVNDEQEIIEEPDSDEVEVSSDELTDGQDDCTGDVNIEDPDEDTAEISFEDQQEVGAGETKEYLKDLSVYSGYGVKDPLEMTRREDLDETYGGKTYTVEIGSSYNSNGFYVTADLGADAPQGSTIQLSACDLDGKIVESEIITTGYTDGKRYNFSNIFTKDNGKRAVYTVTAGTEADSQTYKIVVLRRLDLSMIGCYLPSDNDMAKNLISEFDSAGITRDYEVAVGQDTKSVKVTASAFNDKWYGLTVNGQAVSDSKALEIPLTGSDTEILFQMKEDGTYQDPAYQTLSYTSTGTYKVTVHKKSKVTVTFKTEPSDAVVSVYDSKGERVEPSKDADTYDSLYYGDKYTWNVSKYGYISKRQEFTVGEESEIKVTLEQQTARQEEITDNDWSSYQNSETNNGITDRAMPTSKNTITQKWATRLDAKGWDAALTPPLILGGYVYVASGQFIYKMDKNTGDIVQTSERMSGNMQYAMIPLAYAEGMLFAQIGGGQIQALSATTLKSLWISEKLGGQTLSPITYKNGYIYTGTWNSDTTPGSYFCLSVTDENPSKGNEIKYCTWKYDHKGGFYWAGAYASENYLVFGSDDGAGDAYTSILYSVNTHTGQLIDKRTDLIGDIRSTITYNNGYVYFTTKGGYLYRVAMNADGTFGAVAGYNLGGAATSTPVVYKNRIYVGVCGTGGQYNADGGHHFDVINESASGLSLAYKVSIPGYPQAAPILSTAYENQDFDGDGKADGRVYLYFTYNAYPGGIYMLTDTPGQTSGKAEELFRPVSKQQEYCISPLCVDKDGTIYYKNDSCYLMALETNGAYLDSVTARPDTGSVNWDKRFQASETEYTLRVAENAKNVTLSFKAPAGCTMKIGNDIIDGTYVADVSSGKAEIKIAVVQGTKSREYTFHLTKDHGNSSLTSMIVSTSNTYGEVSHYLSMTPAFNSAKTSYTVEYLDSKAENTQRFLRVYVEKAESDATVKTEMVKGVKRVTTTTSGNATRFNVYWEDGVDEAQVKFVVTAKAGSKTEYLLTIQRKVKAPTPTPTEIPEVFGPWQTVSTATVFAPEQQRRTSNKGRQETRTVGSSLTPTIKLNATSIKLKVKQSTTKVQVSGLAAGDRVQSWTTSNKKVATVTSRGKITAKKTGKARIIITLASGKKAVVNVTVQKTAVKTTKISGLKRSVVLKRRQKLTLKPVISPITSVEKVTYKTSNKKVATVNSRGVITAKKKGTAKITVKSGKKTYTVTVKVK